MNIALGGDEGNAHMGKPSGDGGCVGYLCITLYAELFFSRSLLKSKMATTIQPS